MQKNVTGQKWIVFAFNRTDSVPETGDAANITANLRPDGGAADAVDDTNPTELEDGYYVFDITQDESDFDLLMITPVSSTGDIQVIGVPGVIWTTPPNFSAFGIESDGDVTQVNTSVAVTNGVTLADDAITSAKFDESTAFPVKSADSGDTKIARTGADSDTLETLSDQLDAGGSAGPGDFAVTVTIRTTGGTPISGISIWVNSTNTRSGSVAGTKVTDTNGLVTFQLEYTTYYIFCHLSGYTFASASFTAASGNVTFTKNIGTAISAGASSSYDESFITRNTTDVRELLDEPQNNAKYTDARIINHLEKAYIHVVNEVNRNSKTQVVARLSITVESGLTEYVLPFTVASVLSIYDEDDTGGRVFYYTRGRHNPYGRGLWIEGKTIHLQTTDFYGLGTTLTIEYIPSGVARLHNGTCTISSDGQTITFGATPNVGTLDTHVNAYAGSIFRHLLTDGSTVTGNNMAERTITAYDESNREATLDVALNPIPTTDDGNIYYEIAPPISKGMDEVVGLYAAYQISSGDGNRKRRAGILETFRNAMRNVRLTEYYAHMDISARVQGDNNDNRRYRRI